MTLRAAAAPQEPPALGSALDGLRQQWRGSRVLRLGCVLAGCILAVEGLHRIGEAAVRLDEQSAEISLANQRLAADLKREPWSARLDEAGRHLQAARSLTWAAPDEALLQANLQDGLRALATKAGLEVREIRAARQVTDRPDAAGVPRAGSGGPGADSAPVQPWAQLEVDGVSVWRLKLVADFKKVSLANFLAELSAQQPALVTERLQVRTGRFPSTLELEVRALARLAPTAQAASAPAPAVAPQGRAPGQP